MGGSEKNGVKFAGPGKRGAPSSKLADRLVRAFSAPGRAPAIWESNGGLEHPVDEHPVNEPPVDEPAAPAWDHTLGPFPITRQGYDCAVVDQHVAALERELTELDQELAQLRARTPPGDEVAAEIERIGEQTSTILVTAHDKAQEIRREAQAQADRCLSDAASNAIAITEEANRKRSQLEEEATSLRRQRERLLQDVRTLAGALSSVADEAAERFPPQPEK